MMNRRDSDGGSYALRGSIDRGALIDFRDTFERAEPLADAALGDFLDPHELRIELSDGVGTAESARFDVVWTMRNDYNIHYTDAAGRNLRWDVHANDYPRAPEDKHFHPPPAASSDPSEVEDSCIDVSEIELVARATQKLWRNVYELESFDGVNEVSNPP